MLQFIEFLLISNHQLPLFLNNFELKSTYYYHEKNVTTFYWMTLSEYCQVEKCDFNEF